MGAFGGYERGREQVAARLDWAAKGIASTDRQVQNVVTVVGGDLAYTAMPLSLMVANLVPQTRKPDFSHAVTVSTGIRMSRLG